VWAAVGYGNIVAGLNLYTTFSNPNAGPVMKTLAIVQQLSALVPILAPSVVRKINQLMQTFCFSAGTQVITEDGPKSIENIREGDLVWSQSDRTGEITLKRVKQVFVNVAASLIVLHSGTNVVECTPAHPFWVAGEGWVAAGQIKVGDELWTRSGERVAVNGIEHKQGQFTVYNVEVEDTHSYFVGGSAVLTHNGNCEAVEQLLVSASQARATLRAALGNSAIGKFAHHIIPWECRYNNFLQKAAAGGFNINGANNGIALTADVHWGSHPDYNAEVWEGLEQLSKANPNASAAQAAQLAQQYADQLRIRLQNATEPLE
jgi:hypothetical protein